MPSHKSEDYKLSAVDVIRDRIKNKMDIEENKWIQKICEILDQLMPINNKKLNSYLELITYVEDRPGHDLRYAIDSQKIKNELGWEPTENFDSGIIKTVNWYLNNRQWTDNVQNGNYQLERLGVN